MKTRHEKGSITQRVLIARVRRTLRKAGEDLCIATAGQRQAVGVGKYYVIDSRGIIDRNVDLEALARELKVLQPWETLSD